MNIYIYIGGAYGDTRWTSLVPPNQDQLKSFSCGELEIFKIDSEMRVYEPYGNEWKEIERTTV